MGHGSRRPGPALSPEHCIQLCHERPSCTVAATAARKDHILIQEVMVGAGQDCTSAPALDPLAYQAPSRYPPQCRPLTASSLPPRAAARRRAPLLAAVCRRSPPRATHSRPAPPKAAPRRRPHLTAPSVTAPSTHRSPGTPPLPLPTGHGPRQLSVATTTAARRKKGRTSEKLRLAHRHHRSIAGVLPA